MAVSVFISYRRSVSRYLALLIFKELTRRRFDPFLDIDFLDGGEFGPTIIEEINAREYFVILLAHGSLERCIRPKDWLRVEIETAIEANRTVIPILVDGFTFDEDARKCLEGKVLSRLPDYNGIPLFYQFFDAAINQLCEHFLKRRPKTTDSQRGTPGNVIKRILRRAANMSDPTDAELKSESLFIKGIHEQKLGNIDDAIIAYTQAIDFNPASEYVYLNRGQALAYQGDLNAALTDFTAAIDINPQHTTARYIRSMTHLNLNHWHDAITDLDCLIQLKPDDDVAYCNRGIAYDNLNDLTAARRNYDKAVQINPNQHIAYLNRAFILAKQGDNQAALHDLNRVVQIDPTNLVAHLNRGVLHYHQGDWSAAEGDFNVVIANKPDNASALLYRAQARLKQHNLQHALVDLRRAQALLPDDTNISATLSSVLSRIEGPTVDIGQHLDQRFTEALDQQLRKNMQLPGNKLDLF